MNSFSNQEFICGRKTSCNPRGQICIVRMMRQRFRTKLSNGFHSSCSIQSMIVLTKHDDNWPLKKGYFIIKMFLCCIHRYSVLFRNFLFLSAKMSALIGFNISTVLVIVGLPYLSSFWIVFRCFLNNFADFILFEFSCQKRKKMIRDLFSSLNDSVWLAAILNSLKRNSENEISF